MLFNLLSQELGIEAIGISDLISITPKRNSKKNISTKYYLTSSEKRSFLYADFYYMDKYIFIIETLMSDIF